MTPRYTLVLALVLVLVLVLVLGASRARAPAAAHAAPPAPFVAPDDGREWLVVEYTAVHLGRDVRQRVVRDLPAHGWIGSTVQAAMARPGSSDPRLLDLLGALPVSPGALAPAAAAVDGWLGLALVDLQRQIAGRCARLATDRRADCYAEALRAEEELFHHLPSDAAEGLAVLHLQDRVRMGRATCEVEAEALSDGALDVLGPEICLQNADLVRLAVERRLAEGFPDDVARLSAARLVRQHGHPDLAARLLEGLDPRQTAVAWERLHAFRSGAAAPRDWRDAVATVAVACARGRADARLTLARDASGAWKVRSSDPGDAAQEACSRWALSGLAPDAPPAVGVAVRRRP